MTDLNNQTTPLATYNENQWLAQYAKNIVSQLGEDGILEKIFEVMKIPKGWCVELGAWDGKHLSNTYNLIINRGWSGVLIEGDKRKFSDLLKTYKILGQDNSRVIAINNYIPFEGTKSLDNVLSDTPIPKDFDFLSIDIDGNDYHLWDSLHKYTPKVVCIEHNGSIPHNIEFVQPRDMKIWQGSSPLSLQKLGKSKGYELVYVNQLNSIFVQKQYYSLFSIKDNSLQQLWPETLPFTQFFQLFDGTLVLHGPTKLLWHDEEIRQEKIQVIPKFLRFLPQTKTGMIRLIQKVYLWLYRRNLI